MADVVSQLKLTPKGRLVYNSNWTAVDLMEDVNKSSIHISPFVVKNTTKIRSCKDSDGISKDTVPQDYSNYFSPEKQPEKAYNVQEKTFKKAKNIEKTIRGNGELNLTLEDLASQSYSSSFLKEADEDYNQILKNLSNLRLQKMKSQLQQIDYEHEQRLQAIENSVHVKYQQEFQQLQIVTASDICKTEEVSDFEDAQNQRNIAAAEKMKQIEQQRKDLEAKIIKQEEEKRLRKEKLKALAANAEPAMKIVSQVTEIYQKHKDLSKGSSQNLGLLIGQVTNEYNSCSDIIRQGINAATNELDSYIQGAQARVKTLQNLLKACQKILDDLIEQKHAEAEKLKKDEEEKAKQQAAAAAAAAAAQAAAISAQAVAATVAPGNATQTITTTSDVSKQVPVPSATSILTAVPALAPIESMLRPILDLCCPKSAFIEYLRLQKYLLHVQKQHEPLSKATDKAKKAYKFDLYKAVNTTINAISDESPKHLLDKIMKMNSLLTQQEIEMYGKKICVKDNEALLLCKELLAKKLVSQGTSQIASSFKTAFPIAAFATGLWALFPDVGEMILAHLQLACPYIVPFYIPKDKNMSIEDYCKLLGYSVEGKDIESEDKYLKKLSGIVRLYAAIIQTEMPPQLGNRNHPHGLEHGWTWLSRLLNLEPRPSVTATVIFDFLEVTGNAMMKRFGKQFQKLLSILCQHYLPKILKVTPTESKPSVIRLKMFLETCIKNGTIKEPEGQLSLRWWGR